MRKQIVGLLLTVVALVSLTSVAGAKESPKALLPLVTSTSLPRGPAAITSHGAVCYRTKTVRVKRHRRVIKHIRGRRLVRKVTYYKRVIRRSRVACGKTASVPTVSTTLPPNPVANPGTGQPAEGSPLYLQQVYDLTALSATAGLGQTVAVYANSPDPTLEQDLDAYRSAYNLPPCTEANGCLSILNESSPQDPMGGSWQGETDTDVEMVSAICPLCHIMLLDDSEPDLYSDALAAKVAGATVLSMSVTYIGGHISDPGSVLPTVESSGDQGPNVDYEQEPIGNSDITAAGGTTVIPDPRTPRGYDEYAWDGSGSGCSTGFVPSYQAGLNTGCQGRAYADVSAIADPSTGPQVYINGNWGLIGGTSVSAPIIAAYYALLQSQGLRNLSSPAWAYGSASSSLNDIAQDLPASTSWSLGANGDTESSNWTPSPGSYCTATPNIPLCTAQTGWDGPTGMGSISGDLIEGSPGIGSNGYVANSSSTSFTVDGGVYTNGEATQVYLQYGPTSAYGYQTAPISLSPAYGASPVSLGVTNTASNGNFHYRIVAVNGSGTSYGYDETVAGDPWDNN